VTHILKVNCAEITKDRPGQPAYEIFSIKRIILLHIIHWLPRWQDRCCRASRELFSNCLFVHIMLVKLAPHLKNCATLFSS